MRPAPHAPTSPWDARWHLRAELAAVFGRLADHLARERQRGGGGLLGGDAVALLSSLSADWSEADARAPVASLDPTARSVAEKVVAAERAGQVLPLAHAKRSFDLAGAEWEALLLALAAEIDVRAALAIAMANGHVGRPRPTLGLAVALAGEPATATVACLARPAFADVLLELEGDGPLSTRSVRIPPALLPRLTGEEPRSAASAPADPQLIERLVLLPHTREALLTWSTALRNAVVARGAAPRPLLLVGERGGGRTAAARAAVGAAGLPLVVARVLDPSDLSALAAGRREARWHDAALLVEIEAEHVDAPALWTALPAGGRPLVVVAPRALREAIAAAAPEEPAVVPIPDLAASDRALVWAAMLPAGSAVDTTVTAELAGRFRFPPATVHRVVRRAVADASLSAPSQRALDRTRLLRAARERGTESIGRLAERLPTSFRRSDLVVPTTVEEELDLAVAWVTHRSRVMDEWGFGRESPRGQGLAALFAGPPGTGKTMAAQVLASELEMDLYRVDLSRVVSKYIGETEKNLAAVFDDATASGVALLFDEGDALFGKRGEVQHAHDRHANLEVGYLLQRMEDHEGVVILATNRLQDLDPAFLRRFRIAITFPVPGPGDRLRIWRAHLPAPSTDEELGLEQLAEAFELAGGEIRNATLAAAFLAAADGTAIRRAHLQRAVRRELRKAGRIVDERLFPPFR
jgi:AAA+ superfamily predicted ATPase